MDDLTAFAETNTAGRLRQIARRGALSHAFLFTGAGDRLAAARYTAAAMQCENTAECPCLHCNSCRKVVEGIHPDVIFVRDDQHKEVSIGVVRDARTDAFIAPNEGKRKIYIFENAALLNARDQNTLLKIVEEGPPYAAFLFCAEDPTALLETTRSRCAVVRTAPAGREENAPSDEANSLCRVLAEGDAAARAEWFVQYEEGKHKREELAALLDEVKSLFSDALASLCGVSCTPERQKIVASVTSHLTKQQILGTIEVLTTAVNDCRYNISVGPLLGGLATEWEEIL